MSFRKIAPAIAIASLLFAAPYSLLSQSPGIGQWRTHLPYRNVTSLADAGDKIYCSGNVTIFSYDKETSVVQGFDKITGLSDIGVRLVAYSEENEVLLIAYNNTNIDLLHKNSIINVSDIKRKAIAGEKTINSVYFLEELAYLSCSFGIVVLDLEKIEIKDTYIIGEAGANLNVNALSSDEFYFYAATSDGIKRASRNSPNLANFQEWVLQDISLPVSASDDIVSFGNNIYTVISDTVFKLEANSWNYYYSSADWRIRDLSATDQYLIFSESSTVELNGRLLRTDQDGVQEYIHDDYISIPSQAVYDKNGTLWVADFLQGLVRIEQGRTWWPISPNGPDAINVKNISVNRNQVWVAPGGINASWGHSFDPHGFYSFTDNQWRNYNQYTNQEIIDLISFFEVLVHPSDDIVYYGTFWNGLLEVNHGNLIHYTTANSSLEIATGDPPRIKVTGLALDNNNNLWVSNLGSENFISVKKPDGAWQSFKPNFRIEGSYVSQMVVDDWDQKWIVVPRGANSGILVFNHGVDIDNTNDGDQFRLLRSNDGVSNLHTNEIFSIAKDLDGEIWVGTAEGITVFYCPSSIFSEQSCQAQRILVTVDGFTGYLLESEVINTIAIDGANRKWIGTNNGVWLLSAEGTQQLAYFTEDNSPLLSNIITDIAIDGKTGEVFIGTDRGLISYQGEATAGEDSHEEVLVYPNPVKHDYNGPIAIRGLANNADVKITDVSGTLIYQTIALGGQAVWNGRSPNGNRAKSGVYLVFSTNEDGSSKYVAKLLIVN